MQVETPHHPPSSAREFVRQYAMIVLSILTALALERVAVHFQNRADAAASRGRIEAELARNARDLETAERTDRENSEHATAFLHTLIDEMKAGKPLDPGASDQMRQVFDHFVIAVPTFQRSAWEAAIADQSARNLPPADLQRYAEIYASAADCQTTAQLLLGGEWLSQGAGLLVDNRLGKVDQRNLANLIARFLMADQQIEANETVLSALIAAKKASGRKS